MVVIQPKVVMSDPDLTDLVTQIDFLDDPTRDKEASIPSINNESVGLTTLRIINRTEVP